jgi:phytoene synthase
MKRDAFDPSLAECTRLMAGGSKSFFSASRVLPARVRAPATALYAFCRVADDAIDGSAAPAAAEAALADLHARLDAVYAGRPGSALADRALACVVERFALPRALLDALLEGFAWDAAGRRYETIDELHDYGARVAGTVGAMMAVVMEARERVTLARACELGLAMQLTNIVRDVGEDARAGRLYLPRQWLREAGIDADDWLAAPRFDGALGAVVQRLLDEAERLYRRAECGVAHLPRDCRPGIQAARLVYAEIGRQVQAQGLDSVSRRAVVPRRRKLSLMARAATALLFAPGHPLDFAGDSAPQRAVRFLVDAAAANQLPARTFYQRTVRVLELFERVGQRQRGLAGGIPG